MKNIKTIFFAIFIMASSAQAQTSEETDTIEVLYETGVFNPDAISLTINGKSPDSVKHVYKGDVIVFEILDNPNRKKAKKFGQIYVYQSNGYYEIISVFRDGRLKHKITYVVN